MNLLLLRLSTFAIRADISVLELEGINWRCCFFFVFAVVFFIIYSRECGTICSNNRPISATALMHNTKHHVRKVDLELE